MSGPHHSIRVVSRRTGLSPHVIRIWEKRYAAVAPARTGTNRRLYSDVEVERLSLLREAIACGHSIGNIARLSTDELKDLVRQSQSGENGPRRADVNGDDGGPTGLLKRCLGAIKGLDSHGLEQTLTEGLLKLGHQAMLRQLIAPLTQALGQSWREGDLTAAHEHFASALIRVFLGAHSKPFALSNSAPCLVVATPVGQLHELGAVMVGAAAANLGWRVTYLGTSLPAAEIAGVAAQHKARAVALSLVYPEDDPALAEELVNLRRFLPPDVAVLAGGRATKAYAGALKKVGALITPDLAELNHVLDDLRAAPKGRQ